jgi:hypothetical protein
MELNQVTATRIIEALSWRIDKKPASAKTFDDKPSGNDIYDGFDDAAYATKRDSDRTKAFMLAYAVFSGGRIPKAGIQIADAWFHPDIWVIKAMLNKGYMVETDGGTAVELTEGGWSLIAEAVEGLLDDSAAPALSG